MQRRETNLAKIAIELSHALHRRQICTQNMPRQPSSGQQIEGGRADMEHTCAGLVGNLEHTLLHCKLNLLPLR